MPGAPPEERLPFQYAVLRLVPRVERGERMNVGVILFCRARRFLSAQVRLDHERVSALYPGLDPGEVLGHLDATVAICAGDVSAGPIARLPPAERFRWLVAPSSTIIQPSEVHVGLTADPAPTLDHLFQTLVEMPVASDG